MSIVKVIEVISEGKTIEDGLKAAVKEAGKTIKHIKQIDLKWVHAHVEKNKITNFRITAKISFVVDHKK